MQIQPPKPPLGTGEADKGTTSSRQLIPRFVPVNQMGKQRAQGGAGGIASLLADLLSPPRCLIVL